MRVKMRHQTEEHEVKNSFPVCPDPGTGLYDVGRFAQRLGVKSSTLRSMRRRGQLPEPLSASINGGAVWSADSVEAFAASDSTRPKRVKSHAIDQRLPRVIDLFSGCGGLSLGFQKAGWDVLAGFDNWDEALEIYNANMSHEAFKLDLSDVDKSVDTLAPWMKHAGVIIGGPPCQDFSSAGKRVEGEKADLTEKFAELIVRLRPEAFVMENVERAKGAYVFQRALSTMKAAGYGITKAVLDASLCGVPQRRKRLITIGILGGEDRQLDSALAANLSTMPMTLREYFGDSLDLDVYYRHPRSYKRRGIFSVDEPSPTIRGVNRPVPPGYPGHPGDAAEVFDGLRPLTTEERAQVQTFPPDFSFGRSKTAAEQMIGNAVPVELAAYVADVLSDHFNSLDARGCAQHEPESR